MSPMAGNRSSYIESFPAANYTDPETRGNSLYVISVLLSVFSAVVIAARLWARFVIVRKPGLDDGLMVIATGFGIAEAAAIIVASDKFGGDRHLRDIPPTKFEGLRFYNWLSELFFILSTGLTKISILLFYRRLSSGVTPSTRFKWALRGGVLYNVIYAVSFVMVLLLKCRPLEAVWKAFTSPGFTTGFTCIRQEISITASGVASVIGDIYATLLPFLVLRNVQLPPPLKKALYGLFSLGGMVVVLGILRTVWLAISVESSDVTWYLWVASVFAILETHLAIICASAPALRPFFIKYISNPASRLLSMGHSEAPEQMTPNQADSYLNASLMTRAAPRVSLKMQDSGQKFRGPVPWEDEDTPPPVPPKDDWYFVHGYKVNNVKKPTNVLHSHGTKEHGGEMKDRE